MVNELLLIGDFPKAAELANNPLAIDSETTGLKWSDSVIGVSLAWRVGEAIKSCYLAVPDNRQIGLFTTGKVFDVQALYKMLEGRPVILHNHSFDFRHIWKDLGVQPIKRVVDTMHLSSHIEPQEDRSLLALYSKYVGPPSQFTIDMKKRRGSLEHLPSETVAEYASEDARMTFRLYETLRLKAAQSSYGQLYDWDERFEYLVMQMVVRGLPVDREFCKQRIKDFHRRMITVNQELVSQGIRNPGAPKDVMTYAMAHNIPLDDTQEETLSAAASQLTDVNLPKVVEYRQMSKSISSWLEPLLGLSEMDGNFHSELAPFGTRSYRMSSRDLNAQGIPMDPKDKRAGGSMFGIFKSRMPGYSLWALDLKQAEVRLAAILSGDVRMQETMASGEDPYISLAVSVWGDASKRSLAKRALLSSIYEIGPHSFARKYGVTDREAKATLDLFRSKYPQMQRHSKNLSNFAGKNRYTELVTGRRRFYFDEPSYEAFNQSVQGSLAEVCHEWMLQVEDAMPERLVLQVHDSLILYLSNDPDVRLQEVLMVGELAQASTEKLIPSYGRNPVVPMALDAKPYQAI